MGAKINIAEILKDKPVNTKLYSPFYGNCILAFPEDMTIKDKSLVNRYFYEDGRGCLNGEIMLFPSKEMRDWRKFAWKKGDVLVSNDGGTEVIFDKWYDDTYTSFYGKHNLNSENENKIVYHEAFLCTTERYSLEEKDSVQTYINTIEERLGGKLNRETLEIEKVLPEFKDGDILACIFSKGCIYIFIFRCFSANLVSYYINKDTYDNLFFANEFIQSNEYNIRYATEEEKQQLFDALAKEGKAWDAEKKQVVDLKPKWTPKPFDRVITRNAADDVWTANIFSHMDSHGEYVTIACVGGYTHCLPYNEDTAKLIGTTKDVEG